MHVGERWDRRGVGDLAWSRRRGQAFHVTWGTHAPICTKPESFTENAGPARGCILIVSLLVYFIKSRNNTKCPLALTCSIHFTTY